MAGQDGRATHDLAALRELRGEPRRFELFAALRLLERVEPDRPRLGEARRPADEWVRVEQPPHLNFAPTAIAAADTAARGRLRLEQFGFGIFGPNGALPFHLTEHAFERRRHHEDGAISDFVNLFQHRLATLFYRAWADSDPAASHARPDDDAFAGFLGALIGFFDETAERRDSIPDRAKLFRSGLLSSASRSADGLETLLTDYFRQRIRIRQFVGSWLRVPSEQRTHLAGEYAVLGRTAALGGQSWQCQNRFEVVIGPLPFEDFLGFLPGSRALRSLSDLIRLYTSGEWSWQLRLLVDAGEAQGVTLGRSGRLGWTSWLGRSEGVSDDVLLHEAQTVAA